MRIRSFFINALLGKFFTILIKTHIFIYRQYTLSVYTKVTYNLKKLIVRDNDIKPTNSLNRIYIQNQQDDRELNGHSFSVQ